MEIDLKDKVIVVTGASRGIGLAVTTQLLKSGATVAAQYNQQRDHLDALSLQYRSLFCYKADLSIPDQTIVFFNDVIQKTGKIDVLINNAGIALNSQLESNTEKWIEEWDFTMAVNLRATGILCREAIRFFQPNGGGIIVNVSSRAAFRGDTEDFLAYAASKGGVVALTRSIARAYGKDNITAFNIAPGFVRTDMATQFIEEYGEEFASSDIALNKLTEPKDIAPLIVFLSSGLAKHATGGTFDVNAASYVH